MVKTSFAHLKNSTTIIIILALAGAGATLFLLGLKTLHRGTTVTLPITITVETQKPFEPDTFTATRHSRGGALFPIATSSMLTWSTTEWVAGITLHYPPDTVGTATITIGATAHTLALPTGENGHQGTGAEFYIDKNILTPPNQSALPLFTTLLNWPGDGQLIWLLINTHGPLSLICGGVAILVLLLIRRFYRLPAPHFIAGEQTNFNHVLLSLYCLIVSLVAATLFLKSGPTAFDWPAMDMGPFFSRSADQNFLPDDFFTNASMVPNPRFIFGHFILALTTIFATDWYTVLFFLKAALVIATPPLVLLALAGIFSFIRNPRTFAVLLTILFLFVLGSLFTTVTGFFTVALWPPLMLQANAHSLSFALGLLAMILAHSGFRVLSHLIFFTATLVHPVIGLCILATFLIVHLHEWQWRRHASFLLSGLIVPFFFIGTLFPPPPNALNAAEFTNHYILQNHAFHYFPSYFIRSAGSFTPWEVNFAFTTLILSSAGYLGWRTRDRFLLYTGTMSALAYTGSIVVSYLFVELYSIKILAALGPSRFTMMGYWCVAVVVSYILAQRLTPYATPLYHRLRFTPTVLHCGVITLLFALILAIGTQRRDNPQATWAQAHPLFATWVATTPKDSVFASNLFDINVRLPLFGKRAVVNGNGFPFHESSFVTYNERRALLFGAPSDWKKLGTRHQGVGSSAYFRSLTPDDFVTISTQVDLDYVIIESGFSSAFSGYIPVYRDNELSVFAISDFIHSP